MLTVIMLSATNFGESLAKIVTIKGVIVIRKSLLNGKDQNG
jgi:hypothetical protein